MIDNFITYEDPAGVTESDGYLSKLREEMFQYGAVPPQHYSYPPQHHHYPPQVNPIMHGDPSYEVFSHNSAYSTNPSTKESPEHTPLEDHLGDDASGSRVPPIVRKGIRKYYEPILDGGMVYNYEDDPSEYRKARKRIQNRESATRVRNRKKNHVEILEDEIIDLKKVISDLKTDNHSLHSENQNLKHKLSFFEKAVAKNNQVHQMNQMNQMNMNPGMNASMPNGFVDACPPPTDHILDFMDSNDQIGLNNRGQHHEFEAPQHNMQHPGFYRASNNSSKFKKHMALLGVFTLLLCVYGILPRTGVQLFALPKFNFGTSNNVSSTPQPNNHNEGSFMNGNSNTTTVNPTSKPDQDFGPNMKDREQNGNNNHEEGNNFDHREPQSNNNNGPSNQKSSNSGPFNGNKNKTPSKPNMKNGNRRDFRGDPRDPRRRPPPNKGHHHAWAPQRNQQKNQESNAYTVSILSVIEILVVACYSIYFIYVGFSAYKLHAAKKRRGGGVPVPL